MAGVLRRVKESLSFGRWSRRAATLDHLREQTTFRHMDIQFHCVCIADLASDPLARFEVIKPGRFPHGFP